ncbi:MAG TPA: PIN domain-containing protein [Pseudonocardia sp.]|uniref:PIN domain-containing protein n=1 Tax=Pseudonocardia sp. TaxID=60912 RepID=UPI002ED9C9C1
MAILIDTSVLVAVERGKLPRGAILEPGEQYAISVVTAAELLHGVHRAGEARTATREAFVEGLLDGLPTLPIDMRVARSYARASATLATKGTPVDANDLWIAATALAYDLEVLALDGDYDRIPGVRRVTPGVPRPR